MLLITAAAIIASTSQPAQGLNAGASVQAMATVRVISGVRLSFGEAQNGNDVPRARQTLINTGDVPKQPAKLIEFE